MYPQMHAVHGDVGLSDMFACIQVLPPLYFLMSLVSVCGTRVPTCMYVCARMCVCVGAGGGVSVPSHVHMCAGVFAWKM
jgi:hypothetical protein